MYNQPHDTLRAEEGDYYRPQWTLKCLTPMSWKNLILSQRLKIRDLKRKLWFPGVRPAATPGNYGASAGASSVISSALCTGLNVNRPSSKDMRFLCINLAFWLRASWGFQWANQYIRAPSINLCIFHAETRRWFNAGPTCDCYTTKQGRDHHIDLYIFVTEFKVGHNFFSTKFKQCCEKNIIFLRLYGLHFSLALHIIFLWLLILNCTFLIIYNGYLPVRIL